ncbi:hypothetical protein [Archaeoglobus sp.]
MNEAVVNSSELQILLNLIDGEISVMYPLYKHFDLFKAERYENCCRSGYRLKSCREKLILMSSKTTLPMPMKYPPTAIFWNAC